MPPLTPAERNWKTRRTVAYRRLERLRSSWVGAFLRLMLRSRRAVFATIIGVPAVQAAAEIGWQLGYIGHGWSVAATVLWAAESAASMLFAAAAITNYLLVARVVGR